MSVITYRIHNQKHGKLTEGDRLEMARLLIKAGYTVRIFKQSKTKDSPSEHYVEYTNGKGGAQC